MIRSTNTAARWVTVVALVAAVVAAIAAPATASYQRPDDRTGIRGPGVAVHQAARPDDRAGVRGVVEQSRVLSVVRPLAEASRSFDWNDALIGAGAASGGAAALALLAFAMRRHARVAPAALPSERSL
jgi:hypothetical protein